MGRRLHRCVAGAAVGLSSAIAFSSGSGAAAPAEKPKNTSKPTISGTTQVGSVLTASPGTWTGTAPISFGYQWMRCAPAGDKCHPIPGAAGQTYTLVPVDRGNTLRVFVTATNPEGQKTEHSAPTGVVQPAAAPAPPAPQAPPAPPPPPPPPAAGQCASIASIAPPDRLNIDRIEYNPSRIHSRSQPLVARFHVTSGRGCVQGATVYAVGVPFDRLSKESEVATGSDGWASVTFQVLPTFQLRPGNLVVIFVRARKAGESVLGGVSNRRLVSVRVG